MKNRLNELRNGLLLTALVVGLSLLLGLFSAPDASASEVWSEVPAKWDSQGLELPDLGVEDLAASAVDHALIPRIEATAQAWELFHLNEIDRCNQSRKEGIFIPVPATWNEFESLLLNWLAATAVPEGPLMNNPLTQAARVVEVTPSLIRQYWPEVNATSIDMSRVEPAAKGLQALEWLFYTQQASGYRMEPSRICVYLDGVYQELRQPLNQTLSAIRVSENLFAQTHEQRVKEALALFHQDYLQTPLSHQDELFARPWPWERAGLSDKARTSVWLGLRPYLVSTKPGRAALEESVISLELFLRSKGQAGHADALRQSVRLVDQAVRRSTIAQTESMADLALRLSELRKLLEASFPEEG